jgi:hypothetical protein
MLAFDSEALTPMCRAGEKTVAQEAVFALYRVHSIAPRRISRKAFGGVIFLGGIA